MADRVVKVDIVDHCKDGPGTGGSAVNAQATIMANSAIAVATPEPIRVMVLNTQETSVTTCNVELQQFILTASQSSYGNVEAVVHKQGGVVMLDLHCTKGSLQTSGANEVIVRLPVGTVPVVNITFMGHIRRDTIGDDYATMTVNSMGECSIDKGYGVTLEQYDFYFHATWLTG